MRPLYHSLLLSGIWDLFVRASSTCRLPILILGYDRCDRSSLRGVGCHLILVEGVEQGSPVFFAPGSITLSSATGS